MVEKLAISEEVGNHISDREAMLSKMNWSKLIMIHVSVAKTSEHYCGKSAFLPVASIFKEAQYKYIQHCMDLQLAVDPYKKCVLFESMPWIDFQKHT